MGRWSRGVAISFISFVLAAAGAASAEVAWPGFRGPSFDGTVRDAVLFEGDTVALELGWKRSLGSGYSAVAVGDGSVVTMFSAGETDVIAAFDTDSGTERWRYRIADAYAGHDGSHDGPISTPLMHGGRVFGLGAGGQLFALEASSGKEIWVIDLVLDHAAPAPYFGFTTSPLIAEGVLVVEIGAPEGKAVAGFDPSNGKLLWTAGDDTIEYHSPIVATFGGRRQVIAAGKDNIYGLAAKTGDVLWSYKHEGDGRAMGGMSIIPLPAGDGRVFLMNKIDSSVMLRVTRQGDEYEIAELWSGNAIKSSYVPPVYHDGYIYGMSNRIFTCLDAATGDIAWRSREPGDGFPTLVGDKLVIITKPGSLHVVEASPEAYTELARLELFEEHSWSEVAFADGHLYARSMAQLARVGFDAPDDPGSGAGSWVATTEFGRFLAEVEGSKDKNSVVDAYLERQASIPIVESPDTVHFVFRGDAEDVGIVGDMIGFRREDPMSRLPGTDMFHYSMRLEPDAALTYGFIPDYGEPVPDPLNPRPGKGLFGEVSWFSMPAWRVPDFLGEAEAVRQGRLETVEWESEAREGQRRAAKVYLPAGYDAAGQRRYPVAYVHNGTEALEDGGMKNALDQLAGATVGPLIAVFVLPDEEDPRADLRNEAYPAMVVEELVPMIDERFRTVAEPHARASIGAGRGANVAVPMAFQHPEVFARAAGQSPSLGVEDIPELEHGADAQPMVIYLDWGTYHMRSPHEAWDLAVESRKLWTALRGAGYRPAGGELHEGYGWACWRAHTDAMLAAMFPAR